MVALRKESVDRNFVVCYRKMLKEVALRKESVDRNTKKSVGYSAVRVALRKESVDRNNSLESKQIDPSVSRSPQGERG